jgi:hypothetical protein
MAKEMFTVSYHHRDRAYRFNPATGFNKLSGKIKQLLTELCVLASMCDDEDIQVQVEITGILNSDNSKPSLKEIYYNKVLFEKIRKSYFRTYKKSLSLSNITLHQKSYFLIENLEELPWMEKMPGLFSEFAISRVLLENFNEHYRLISKQNKTISLSKKTETLIMRLKNNLESLANIFQDLGPVTKHYIKANKNCMGVIVFLKRIGLLSLASGCSMTIEHEKLILEYKELLDKLNKYMIIITNTALYSFILEMNKVMMDQFAKSLLSQNQEAIFSN